VRRGVSEHVHVYNGFIIDNRCIARYEYNIEVPHMLDIISPYTSAYTCTEAVENGVTGVAELL